MSTLNCVPGRTLPELFDKARLESSLSGTTIVGLETWFGFINSQFESGFRRRLRLIFNFKRIELAGASYLAKDIKREIGGRSYLDVAKVDVFTPPGMSSNYHTYVTALAELGASMDRILEDAILPTIHLLSTIANDPTIATAASFNLRDLPKLATTPAKVLAAGLGKCTNRAATDRMAFSKAFRSIGDMEETCKIVYDLAISSGKVKPTTVSEESEELVAVAGRLTEGLKVIRTQVSNKTIAELSDLIYNVAGLVELYAVYQNTLVQTITALADTGTHFGKK